MLMLWKPLNMDQSALDKELFAWKQERLEQGKFPCECGHFESSHVKRMCIACHGQIVPDDVLVDYRAFHRYEQMDNLSLIEYMAAHKNDSEK
jgi:hypothetical protein